MQKMYISTTSMVSSMLSEEKELLKIKRGNKQVII